MSQSHKLAAIMFTDIVGYTKLMGVSENQTLTIIRKSQEIHQKWIKKFNGQWLKELGDGVLASFDSATDAVYCAGAILSEIKLVDNLNLRIGIHLGDIVKSGHEVYGDGVNIASRIQGQAESNQLVVSESIYQIIKNKDGIHAVSIGVHELKNVDIPPEIYYVDFDSTLAYTSFAQRARVSLKPFYIALLLLIMVCLGYLWVNQDGIIFKNKPQVDGVPSISSIAVLPFENLSADSTQEYLLDGLHDNLITALSQISSLNVISRTSSMIYKHRQGKTLTEIANDLGVNALIETSVLQYDDSVRFNIQLVQALPVEKHIWAQIFDRPFENLLFLFDDIARSVAREINLTIANETDAAFSIPRPVPPEAMKSYLNGNFHADIPTPESLEMAEKYYRLAIETDPTFAPPYGGMSYIWIVRLQMRLAPLGIALPKIYEYSRKAQENDENYPQLHYHRALTSLQGEWDWETGEKEFKMALEINPNDQLSHAFYGHLLMFQRRFEEAVSHMKIAVKLDPLNPFISGLYAVVLWHKGDLEQAMDMFKGDSNSFGYNPVTESIYYMRGEYEKSYEMLAARYSNDSSSFQGVENAYKQNGYGEAMKQLARNLEQLPLYSAVGIAIYYNRAEMYEDVLRTLNQGYQDHDPDMPYAFLPIEFKNLEVDPRYIELAGKMNLPLSGEFQQ